MVGQRDWHERLIVGVIWSLLHTNRMLFASNRIRVLILRHSQPTSSSLCLSVAEHHLQQCSLAPNSAAAHRPLHDYAIWAATKASSPAEGALLFPIQSLVLALNVLNVRCTSQATELLTEIVAVVVFACNLDILFSPLPKGGVMLWPCVLGSKCQPVWSRWLHYSKSRRTLPLLEPLQRWHEITFHFSHTVGFDINGIFYDSQP